MYSTLLNGTVAAVAASFVCACGGMENVAPGCNACPACGARLEGYAITNLQILNSRANLCNHAAWQEEGEQAFQ